MRSAIILFALLGMMGCGTSATNQLETMEMQAAPEEAPLAPMQDGPKVFINFVQGKLELEIPPDLPLSIISEQEIAKMFQEFCQTCSVTTKKEAADYAVDLVAVWTKQRYGQWAWTVYENKDGLLLGKGSMIIFDYSVGNAAELVMQHWNKAQDFEQ